MAESFAWLKVCNKDPEDLPAVESVTVKASCATATGTALTVAPTLRDTVAVRVGERDIVCDTELDAAEECVCETVAAAVWLTDLVIDADGATDIVSDADADNDALAVDVPDLLGVNEEDGEMEALRDAVDVTVDVIVSLGECDALAVTEAESDMLTVAAAVTDALAGIEGDWLSDTGAPVTDAVSEAVADAVTVVEGDHT
jgi:hypothetical protein